MPPHTRSQRRRQNTRQQPRPRASVETTDRGPSTGTTVNLEAPAEVPSMGAPAAPAAPPRATARTATPRRRVISRPALEPIDYTKDYAAARIDLRRIALWAALLFVAMIALYFSGIV